MALIWFDGMESYDSSSDIGLVSSPLVTSLVSNCDAIGATQGRRSGYGLNLGYNQYYNVNLANNYSTLIMGAALNNRSASLPTYNANAPVFGFKEGGTWQMKFHIVDYEIQVRRGDSTLITTTSGLAFVPWVWTYLEIKVTFHNSSGVVEIRKDGLEILNITSQDTQNTANAYANFATIWDSHPVVTYMDDMYLCDDSGSKNNGFLGDVRVDVVRPDGAGTYTQFTPSAGSNYENVDETQGPDDDTTYNDGSTPGNKDSYALGSLEALSTTIYGVKSQITARKTDAGSKNVKILTRAGTTDDLSTSISLSDSFKTKSVIHEDNPDDVADWEEADVNAMEVGMEIVTTTTTTMTTTTTS
jgi:hypothetical protein